MPSDSPTLSSILVGDLVAPRAANEPAEYVASIVVLGDELWEVRLTGLVAGYPTDPGRVALTGELRSAIAAAAAPAAGAATLLALVDQEALVLAPGSGRSNLCAFLRQRDPGLIEASGLDDGPRPGRVGINAWLALIVALAVALGAGIAGWVAWRVVSGY